MSMVRKYKRQIKNRVIPVEGIKHPVHGYFVYKCGNCGAIYKMYLDKGLEDHVQDARYPERHKPVPFCIDCRHCKSGFCNHILWGIGDSEEYTELPDGANYFKNTHKDECGTPIITKPDFLNIQAFKLAYAIENQTILGGIE